MKWKRDRSQARILLNTMMEMITMMMMIMTTIIMKVNNKKTNHQKLAESGVFNIVIETTTTLTRKLLLSGGLCLSLLVDEQNQHVQQFRQRREKKNINRNNRQRSLSQTHKHISIYPALRTTRYPASVGRQGYPLRFKQQTCLRTANTTDICTMDCVEVLGEARWRLWWMILAITNP